MSTINLISTNTDFSTATGTKITSSSSSSSSSSTSTAAEDATKLKNQFLTILLTQMEHQNPLDPMDTKEFTAQLTQFSSLEQQIDTNSKLDDLIASLTKNSVSNAFGYLGNTVELDSAKSVMQDDTADWVYALPSAAKSVEIKVKDADGVVVYSGTLQNENGGSIAAGTYNFAVGNDELTELQEEGALLTMSVTALDSSGKTLDTKIHTNVTVNSIQTVDDTTYLQAGGILFEPTDVIKIVAA